MGETAIQHGRGKSRSDPRPLVSVVIPVHNRGNLLRRAVASVQSQIVDEWELIVVDDGSDEELAPLLETFADPRISYVRLDENRGAPVARNIGARHARGSFLTFLDSDDEMLPEYVTEQVAALGGGAIGVLCGFIEQNGTETRVFEPPSRVTTELLIGGPRRWITTGQLMARADVMRTVGFDETLQSYQDWDLFFRLAQRGAIVGRQRPLLIKHHHPGSRIYSGARRHRGLLALASKYRNEIASRPESDLVWRRKIALAHWELGDFATARATLVEATRKHPYDPRLRGLERAARLGPLGFHTYLWASARLRRVRRTR